MTDGKQSEHQYLTVKELADLLRLKERKIYDLASSGEVPCTRATGKLLFPTDEIHRWIENSRSGGRAMPSGRPPIVLGSHDPLLDWSIRQSRCGLATFYDGSFDGLERFVGGEGIAAGLHIHDAKSGSWNVSAVSQAAAGQNAVLIGFAKRSRGLVFRKGGPSPVGVAGLSGLRVVPRQPESGTDVLFRELAAAGGLDLSEVGFTDVARTEDDAVESVRRGDADATFGLQAVAVAYGLDFLPLVEEEFALLVDRKAWFEPAVRTFIEFCGTDDFRHRARSYGGYDVSCFGDILWNA